MNRSLPAFLFRGLAWFLAGLFLCLAAPPTLSALPGLADLLGNPAHAALARKDGQTVSLADTWNPHPDGADIILPMPGGLGMAFRLVAVPATGLLGDMIFRPGIVSTDEADRAYYDRPYTSALSATFILADLPDSWQAAAREAMAAASSPGKQESGQANGQNAQASPESGPENGSGQGTAFASPVSGASVPETFAPGRSAAKFPDQIQKANNYFFYLIGKYEVSRQQWQAIMGQPARPASSQSLASQTGGGNGLDVGSPDLPAARPGHEGEFGATSQQGPTREPTAGIANAPLADQQLPPPPLPPDANAARPVTEISWFDAVEFSRRYTVWLLANHPEALPRFAGDARNTGYLRLPTESEWEYAARGGHKAGIQLLREDFFALPEGAKRSDYAVYRPENALRIPSGSAVIGSRKPNPLGLYDTAGNVAEMVMDCFRFSVGGRLHGSAGGFVRKGGSWFSGDSAILPGRREEIPFFLASGPANARDMGLRLVISGTNTPGGSRPEALHAEWKKAGEGPTIAASQARNPLEELDRLLVMTTDQTTRKNLLALRDSIKESNIMRERQLELEAETIFGTGAYMIETIRNYYSRSAVLETQIEGLERDQAQATGKDLEKLGQILDNARRGRQQLETSLNRSLAFYQTKVEDSASLDPEVARAASANVARDYGGDGPFDQNMRRNLELFVAHVEAWRNGRAIPREKLKKEILERRFR